MPANLTHQYRKAEEEYRRASTPEEELTCLQNMLREIPKHKGTDRLQADLKAKIAKLKRELQTQKRSGKRTGIRIPRQGAGRVVLLGGPNSGKSALLKSLSNAHPEVAPFPFTTQKPSPGMVPCDDVMVQMIDTPPVTKDFVDPDTQSLVRGADLVLLLVDLGNDDGIEQFQEALARIQDSKTRLDPVTRLDAEDLGVTYTRTFLVLNKSDLPDFEIRLGLLRELCPTEFEEFKISAETGEGLDPLKRAMLKSLDVVRVYTKDPHQKEPDLSQPFTLRQGSTLFDVAELIHKDFARNLKFARVWGTATHDGAVVKGNYVVHDRDIVELHL
ncbi:MAG: GTPase [Planctomycetota bacterium]